jgi:cell division protein FtsB
MFFNQALDFHKENEALKQRIKRLEDALREIANQDYRCNRSTESEIAFRALQP